MMDTQRLIAFVVFSFSALLLWDAWQKHNVPKPISAPASASAPVGVPQPAAPLTPPTAPGAMPAAPPPSAAAAVRGGEPILVSTDLFDIEINSQGGDIRRVTMKRVFSATDRSRPLTLLEPLE